MANIGELNIGIQVDINQVNIATKELQNDLKKSGDSIEKNIKDKSKTSSKSAKSDLDSLGNKATQTSGKMQSSFSKFGSVLAGVFSITAILGFTKSLFQLGSDLEEVSSKFDVIFKGNQDLKKSFEDTAEAMNRSKLQFLTFGGNVGNVLAPLGLGQKVVDNMSLSITQLAVDVASFNNVSDAQAVHAFTTALTGEREALKTLGIVINDTDVKNKAYSLGLAKQGQELTKAQTALATYQLFLDNTANAQGDAVRTGDSFANQVKGLKDTIKDTFAKAGRDVANQTSGIIGGISMFVSKYGSAIFTTIINTGKLIWGVISDMTKFFADLFGYISTGSSESEDSVNNFAFVFMKVVQAIGIGVKTIATIFKTLSNVLAIVMGGIIELFMAGFRSIDDGWNILKTSFIGLFKSMLDITGLGVDTIGQIFLGMAEAVVGVFKGIADNVGVAVKKAVNVAINGINGFLDMVNKIPGVNISRLSGLGDANWKQFELNIGKNINKLKTTFSDFGDNIGDNFDGIGDSWDNLSKNFSDSWKNIEMVGGEVAGQIGDDWTGLMNDIVDSNNQIDNAMMKTSDTTKKTTKDLFDIKDVLGDYSGGAETAKEKTKRLKEEQEKLEKIQKKLVDSISDKYKQWQSAIEKLDEAQKQLSENNSKYNESIKDSLRGLQNEVKKTYSEYEKAISDMNKEYGELQEEITKDTGKSLAERNVVIEKELLDLEKELLEIQQERISSEDEKLKQIEETKERMIILDQKILQNTDKTTEATKLQQNLQKKKLTEQLKVLEAEGISIDTQNKLLEIDEKKIKLMKELDVIQNNASADELDEARRIAGLSESELIIENNKKKLEAEKLEFENKVKLEKDKFEAEKESLLRSQEIYNYFLNKKKLDQEDLEETFSDERFKNLTAEEQELIVKLAREKIELTNQKNAIIDMQKEIKKATIDLSYEAFNIQKENIGLLKDEYKELIAEINNAINIQKEFMSKKSTGTNQFATGGYTGDGGIGEVAGVVHKGERVAPAWMVKQLKPLFANLENTRTKGFAEGGYTSNITKNQTNNITVQNQVDLKSFLDYAKWKL